MLWIKAEDPRFYQDLKYFKKKLKKLINLSEGFTYHYFPKIDHIQSLIATQNFDKDVLVAPYTPSALDFDETGFFTVVELQSDNYPFTEEQERLGIPKDVVLAKKLGLTIKKTTLTFRDMAGAERLVEDVDRMVALEDFGFFSISGLFLFGVAGTGKSFFASCFAGQTGRHLVELDLPYFMGLPNPTKAIGEVFEFLTKQKTEKFVLFLDEIEKMFDKNVLVAQQVFGKLLGLLNDVAQSKNRNITFVATANNITEIIKEKPEFLRKGRFDRLYFLAFPTFEGAGDVFNVYKAKNKKTIISAIEENTLIYLKEGSLPNERFEELIKGMVDHLTFDKSNFKDSENFNNIVEEFHFDFDEKMTVKLIEEFFSKAKSSDGRFTYVPAEIQSFAEEMQNVYISSLIGATGGIDLDFGKLKMGDRATLNKMIEEIASEIIPIQISAKEGIAKQYSQKKDYENDEFKPFIEI